MKFRKNLAGVAAASVAASIITLAAPAHAAYTKLANDPAVINSASDVLDADLVGVGSDTTEIAVHGVTDAWNAKEGAPFRVLSFQAGAQPAGGTVPLTSAIEITRPNGSGAGKTLIHGANNNPNIDFARSSDALDETKSEVTDGLKLIPFALDTLKMGADTTSTYAPASLTLDQVYRIYTGEYTDWGQVGGTPEHAIIASALQQSSGTAKFFKKQLDAYAATLGTTFTYGAGIDLTWQEHADFPAAFTADERARAIAPFSVGRAALIPNTPVTMLGGWEKKRALYNVVRGVTSEAGIGLGDAKITALFGSDGFFCSAEAKPLIEAGGFKQLLTPEFGGKCGEATSEPTTNFAFEATATSTTLTAPSSAAGQATLTATVSPSAAGEVEFFDGDTSLGVAQTTAGVASFNATGLTPGAHVFKAVFVHDFGTAFLDSTSSEVNSTVKSASTILLAFNPLAPLFGKATIITATTTGIADGQVVSIKVGAMAAKPATVTANKATISLPAATKAGSYSVVASYAGTDTVASSSATKSLVIAKATPVITETFPLATLVGKPGKGVVKVAIAGSTVKPTGVIKIFKGTKLLKQVTLTNGQASVILPKLAKGKYTLTIKYLGSVNVKPGAKTFTITQK